MRRWLALTLILAMSLLTACGRAAGTDPAVQASSDEVLSSSAPPQEPASELPASGLSDLSGPLANTPPCFFDRMAEEAVAALGLTGGEDAISQIKAAYRYVIARTTFIEYDQPELVDGWRYEDRCGAPPTIYQVMGAGPLLYGIGTCEQYSAALMVLLHRLGFEAVYVPGLTYSVQGTLVDHAWVMVKIDEAWYHIDPQLEDNVMRGPYVSYLYFLKGDADFGAHHVWGGKLPRPDDYSLNLPECPGSMPWQPGEVLEQDPEPDVPALVGRAAQRQAAYTGPVSDLEVDGALPPLPCDMWPEEEDAAG